MSYFFRRQNHLVKSGNWDESKHPRVPAGSGDASGEFTSSSGAGKQGELFPAKESFTEYATRVFDLKGGSSFNDDVPMSGGFSPEEEKEIETFRAAGGPAKVLAGLKAGAKPGSPGSALPGMTVGDVLAHKVKAPTLTASGHRPLSTIAREIRRDWGPKVYFGAKPYLEALGSLGDIKERYIEDSASSVVAYFLGNATGWRGPKAREIKAELNKILKIK